MSKTARSQFGDIGENLACKHLEENGYKIIARNYKEAWGEIDIIAKAPDKVLVFVEVKALRQVHSKSLQQVHEGPVHGLQDVSLTYKPEDHFTKKKYEKIIRTISLYIMEREDLVDENRGWRLDLIAINSYTDKAPEINHYENVSF